jgi:putative endonuclease
MAYREKTPAVYILASRRNGTIYTGVTSDLYIRMPQHKQGLIEGFTKKYKVHMLVYYEIHHLMTDAIQREHRIKEMAPAVEDQADREHEPGVGRSVRRGDRRDPRRPRGRRAAQGLTCRACLDWIPA